MTAHTTVQRREGSSAEKMQPTEFCEGNSSAGGGTTLFSQQSVMVWPLHSRAQMALSCPAQMLHMAWRSCLSVHGQVKKDHGTGLGLCLFTVFTVNLFPGGFWCFQSVSGHLEENKANRLLLVDIRPPCFGREEPRHVTPFVLRTRGWSQQGSSLKPPNPCGAWGKGPQFP